MNFNEALQHILDDKLVMFATPFFILLLIGEYFAARKLHPNLYEGKDLFTSIMMGVFSLFTEFIPKVVFFMIYFAIYQANVFGLNEIMVTGFWLTWVVAIIADDFSYYWFHRFNHEVRFFWAGHVPHHSSEHYNLGTALRQGVGERFHKYIYYIWIPLLGINPIIMFIAMGINLIYQYWVHTELINRLPAWYEFIFNTPSHHRVHHASQARYLDRNHAGILILWDRIFGTFSEEKDFEKPKFGLTKSLGTYNLAKVATHEYAAIWKDVKRADKFSDKLKYIFYPPGWSHDGPDLRAKTLRNQVKD